MESKQILGRVELSYFMFFFQSMSVTKDKISSDGINIHTQVSPVVTNDLFIIFMSILK